MPLDLTPNTPPYYTIIDGGESIKEYIAILNQTGTDNPGHTIIKDTIGINGWVRDSAGVYKTAILSGKFPIGKTTLQITTNYPANVAAIQSTADQVVIYTGNPLSDDDLDNTTVIITVYP